MKKLAVFEPPMCCPTGMCGPAPDPVLPRFAADFHWLASQGVAVERHNLAQEPQAFVANETVKAALEQFGEECLPLVLVDDAIMSRGYYPDRKELARFAGVELEGEPSSLYTAAVAELVAIGAAIASNCEPCLKFHYDKARKLGVSLEDMARAVDTARAVKESPARAVLELAGRLLKRESTPGALTGIQPAGKAGSCCG